MDKFKSAPRRPEPQIKTSSSRCEWSRAGESCRMPGAQKDGAKWFCAWHMRCVKNPRLLSDFKEFEAFLKTRIDPIEGVMASKNLILPYNPWRGNPTTIWRKVGGSF